MLESGGLVYMLGSLHWALQPRQDRAETLLKAAKVEKGLLEVCLAVTIRVFLVHRHQFWKVTWPKCKPRRVPNRNMEKIWKYMMLCIHPIPSHSILMFFFPGSAEKKTLIVQLDRSSWVLHKARLVLPKRLGLADGSSTEFRSTAPKYCRVFGHGSLWIEPGDVTGNSIVILHYALIIE